MRKCFSLVIACLAGIHLSAQMPIYGADSLMKHYQKKADELIVGDSALNNYFFIDLYGITIRDDGREEDGIPPPEYRVNWSELQLYKDVMKNETRADAMQIMLSKGARNFSPAIQKQYADDIPTVVSGWRTPEKPLAGMRIAIDPGHIAHDTALGHLEQKWIFMGIPLPHDLPKYDTVAFAEGQLTWETALILGERLRSQGAEVMYTRSGNGITAFGKTFAQWKTDDYSRALDSLLKLEPDNQPLNDLKSGKMKTDRSIFRFVFKDVELRRRADLINEFHPDLTVVIHYNVDETNAPWSKPSHKNFCMLFVPGSFEKGELDDAESRFDFLRLLLTDDVDKSIRASEIVSKKFEAKLNVPLAKPEDAAYLVSSCRTTKATGVYARNLSMTRLVHGTIVYGETLYQDNWNEAVWLDNRSAIDQASKVTTSKRVIEVAEAYYEGILEWSYEQ